MNAPIKLTIEAQLANGVWTIDGTLHRPSPQLHIWNLRRQGWQLLSSAAPFDTLAASIPTVILHLDRGPLEKKPRSPRKAKR